MTADGDWALVTGGAGGIGSEVVRQLHGKGVRSVITYLESRAGDREAAAALAQQYDGEAVALDLSESAQIDAVVGLLAGRPLIAVVLCAAAPPVVERFRDITAQRFRDQLDIAVIGNHRLLAGVIDAVFRKRKTGVVVGVLSKAMGAEGETAMRDVAPYVVGKYALWGLLKAMKADFGWLRVETVSPTYTDTAMLGSFDPRFVEILREKNMIATPQDIAAEIVAKIAPPA